MILRRHDMARASAPRLPSQRLGSHGDSVGSAEPGMINLNVTPQSLMLLLVTTQAGIRVTVTVTQALASASGVS